MTRQAQGLLLSTAVVISMGLAACSAKVEPERSTERQAELARAEGPAEPACAEHRRHRGPVAVVIASVRQHAAPRPEQEATLAAVEQELAEHRAARRVVKERLRASAVAILRAPSADPESVDRAVDEAMDAVEERVQKGSDALEEIHAVLDPDQRKAVAAALRAHVEQQLGPRPGDEQQKRVRIDRFASRLMLSSLQIDKLMAVKKELFGDQSVHPSREEIYAVVDAFEGEGFGDRLRELREKKTALLRERARNAGRRSDEVLGIFSPEQRALIADLILEGPRKVLGDEPPEAM